VSVTISIVKVIGNFSVGDGRSTAPASEFSDFRKAGDTLFPFKVTSYTGGHKIAETVMKTYTINPAFPDTAFAP
jgi:hypothetical protein